MGTIAPSPDSEEWIRSFQTFVYAVAWTAEVEMIDGLSLRKTQHKRQVISQMTENGGLLYWTQACASKRWAFVLYGADFARKKKYQWYSYHGGGSALGSEDQSPLLQSILVNTKNHKWAAVTCVALWLICCCGSPCDPPPWPCIDLMICDTSEEDPAVDPEAEPGVGQPTSEPEPNVNEHPENLENSFLALCADLKDRWIGNSHIDEEWPFAPDVKVGSVDQHMAMSLAARRMLLEWAARVTGEMNYARERNV